MIEIILYKNKGVCLIDNEDYEKVAPYRWTLHREGYASGLVNHKPVLMHRFLLPGAKEIDHINHNRLDNRRSNIRAVTRSQNSMNKFKTKASSSMYKGVSWHKQISRWRARPLLNYVVTTKTEQEAAYIYDQFVTQVYPEHAITNFDY